MPSADLVKVVAAVALIALATGAIALAVSGLMHGSEEGEAAYANLAAPLEDTQGNHYSSPMMNAAKLFWAMFGGGSVQGGGADVSYWSIVGYSVFGVLGAIAAVILFKIAARVLGS